MSMNKTKRINRIHMRRTMKRRKGGNGQEDTKLAVVSYIRNIATQILNNMDKITDNNLKNTKYSKLTDEKKELYSALFTEMKINYGKFKTDASTMVNQRNSEVHPLQDEMLIYAEKCRELLRTHRLEMEMVFELKVIKSFISLKNVRMTRSMSKKIVEAPSQTKYDTMTPTLRKGDTWARGFKN